MAEEWWDKGWSTARNPDCTWDIYGADGDGFAIVRLLMGDEEAADWAERRAHLIVAAPDMLRALEAMVDKANLKELFGRGGECLLCEQEWSDHEDWCPVPAAQAAIAKAKGDDNEAGMQ